MLRFNEGGSAPAEAPVAASAPIGAGVAPSFDHSDLSPGEARKVAAWQIEDGTAPVSEEVVEPALPVAEPHQYDLGDLADGQVYDESHKEADTAIREWMVQAGLSKGVGTFIAQEANILVPQLMEMDDGQRQLFQQQERVKLQTIWKDDFHRNLKAARQLVQQIESRKPGLIDFLERSGLGDSSSMILQLHHASQNRRK
jgi:hypothetical protein